MLFRLICLSAALGYVGVVIGVFAAEDHSAQPAQTTAPVSARADYELQPFDLIKVEVFQEPDLERLLRLSQDSSVTLPLIGSIDLKGKTISAAQKLIHDLYDRDYLVNPQINVTVMEYAKETVTVLGSVTFAKAVEIPPDQPLKLLDAIGQAGGFTRIADRKHVKLTRLNEDGKTETSIINADDIMSSASSDQWVLQKGDVIYVPERIL